MKNGALRPASLAHAARIDSLPSRPLYPGREYLPTPGDFARTSRLSVTHEFLGTRNLMNGTSISLVQVSFVTLEVVKLQALRHSSIKNWRGVQSQCQRATHNKMWQGRCTGFFIETPTPSRQGYPAYLG